VTLEMKRQSHGTMSSEEISLHYRKGSVDCSLRFVPSPELRNYIDSFGPVTIPVALGVSFDNKGNPLDAHVVTVGEWNASKLGPKERSLIITREFGRGKPGEAQAFKINGQADCFDSANRKTVVGD
jgi:hypothetical protein